MFMKQIDGEGVRRYFEAAGDVAQRATCHRAKCGSVIVSDGEIIGRGYNAPPLEDESQRMCDRRFDATKKQSYDTTCCVHAEWNAVLDACKTNADKIGGSVLYFMRVDDDGNFTDAGEPFCTVCSRLAMQSGVAEFVLWNDGRADIYEIDEYNAKSYEYYKQQSNSSNGDLSLGEETLNVEDVSCRYRQK